MPRTQGHLPFYELGLGDPDRWAAELPPEAFRAFKERIDIDFAPTNQTRFGVDEAVKLDVLVAEANAAGIPVIVISGTTDETITKSAMELVLSNVERGFSMALDGLLSGRDPDEGATRLPYEKGALFLRSLEELFGRARFERAGHPTKCTVEHLAGEAFEQPRLEREIDGKVDRGTARGQVCETPCIVEKFERAIDIVDINRVWPHFDDA